MNYKENYHRRRYKYRVIAIQFDRKLNSIEYIDTCTDAINSVELIRFDYQH